MDTSLRTSLETRLAFGRKKYGHGVRIEDNTTQWNTKNNCWLEMQEEELLDGFIYLGAHYLKTTKQTRSKDEIDDNTNILNWLEKAHKNSEDGLPQNLHEQIYYHIHQAWKIAKHLQEKNVE